MYNLTKEQKLNFILEQVKILGVSAYEISKKTNLTDAGVGRILNRSVKNPHENTLNTIIEFLESKVLGSNLKENYAQNLVSEPEEKLLLEQPTNYSKQLIDCQKETAELYRHVMYLQNLLRDNKVEFSDYFQKNI